MFQRFQSFLFSYQSLGLLALFFLLASLMVKWFDVPLGHSLRSYHLSLFSNRLLLSPQVVSLSFGTAIGVLLLLGSYAVLKNKSGLKLLTGWLAIFLSILIIGKVVSYNLSMAEDIYDQNMQVSRMLNFSKELPPNRAMNATFQPDLSTYKVTDRLYLAWHLLTFGLFLLMFSAVIFIISGFKSYKPKKWVKLLLIPFLSLSLILLAVISKPILAEYHRSEGDAFLSSQQYQNAFHSYKMAVKYNKELMENRTFALNYGEVCYNLKLTASPYYLFYWGDKLYKLQRTLEAIETLTKAHELSPKDSVLKVSLANMLTEIGTDYFYKGVSGSAIAAWEKSLQIAPEQIENWYYLSFVYKNLAFYKKAIFAGEQFTHLSNNSSLNADTYANMGDACYWLKDFLLARSYYEKSKTSVLTLNYRAGKALGGT